MACRSRRPSIGQASAFLWRVSSFELRAAATELRRFSAALLYETFHIFRELLVVGRKLLVLQPGSTGGGAIQPFPWNSNCHPAQRHSCSAGRVPDVVVKFWKAVRTANDFRTPNRPRASPARPGARPSRTSA